MIVPFYPDHMRPHLQCCAQVWGPQHKKKRGPVGVGPEDATKMLSRLEQLCYEDKLRKLGLFILKRRMLQGDLIAAFQFLKKAYKKKRQKKTSFYMGSL